VKLPEVWPDGIVMLLGTPAFALLEDSDTSTPFAGAGVVNVTVPIEEAPPTTEVGLRVKPVMLPEDGEPGFTVSNAVNALPEVAVIVTGRVEDTATVTTGKVPVV
jgi:hypothetical protein